MPVVARSYSNESVHHGVLTLSGYGLRLQVERGHLVVEDGVGKTRRRMRFSRVDRELKRIVLIGHSGSLSLDAVAWLQAVGVPLIHLNYDGRLYFLSAPRAANIAPLRRAQAQAADAATGFRISQALLNGKVARQRALLDQLPDGARARPLLEDTATRIARARTMKELRDGEARAARAYWSAWRDLPIRFTAGAARRRPAHWRVFDTRISPLTDPSPRRAVNPANAVLNYLYAILEAEAHIAALTERLDPSVGVLHRDRPNRDSLASDLMEPVRPVVDAFALSLFRDRTFTAEDVFELPDGQCRLLPPITHELTATAPLWAERVRPVAEDVARGFVVKQWKPYTIVPGIRLPRTSARRTPRGRTSHVRRFVAELPAPNWAAFAAPAPAWSGTRAQRRVFSANRAWYQQHGAADPGEYRATILPELKDLTLRQLGAATGLSKTTCSDIRRGKKIPHPRHWDALRALIAS